MHGSKSENPKAMHSGRHELIDKKKSAYTLSRRLLEADSCLQELTWRLTSHAPPTHRLTCPVKHAHVSWRDVEGDRSEETHSGSRHTFTLLTLILLRLANPVFVDTNTRGHALPCSPANRCPSRRRRQCSCAPADLLSAALTPCRRQRWP